MGWLNFWGSFGGLFLVQFVNSFFIGNLWNGNVCENVFRMFFLDVMMFMNIGFFGFLGKFVVIDGSMFGGVMGGFVVYSFVMYCCGVFYSIFFLVFLLIGRNFVVLFNVFFLIVEGIFLMGNVNSFFIDKFIEVLVVDWVFCKVDLRCWNVFCGLFVGSQMGIFCNGLCNFFVYVLYIDLFIVCVQCIMVEVRLCVKDGIFLLIFWIKEVKVLFWQQRR